MEKIHDISDSRRREEIIKLLEEVVDPEIPVLSVNDMGIIRDVKFIDDLLEVSITPTYSGCPAMDVIATDIRKKLLENGFEKVEIKTVLSPAWTTDWLTENGKVKLMKYGISPPAHSANKKALLGEETIVKCPRCGSTHTTMISNFGSTACKALWKCEECKEPFDYFKCI